MSEATISGWLNKKATPSLSKAIGISDLFGISTDLLGNELAAPDRFAKVEQRIRRAGTNSGQSDHDSLTMDENDEWAPGVTPDPEATPLKWGYNGGTGAVTVWEVAGPGDGYPSHQAYLTTAWGRAPRRAEGDVVGFAEWRPPTLAIHVDGGELPAAVDAHFRTAYPDARIARS